MLWTSTNSSQATPKPGPSIDILLVDDEARLRESLANILALSGHQVITAEGGIAAIKLLKSHNVHLMLLNLNMPDMNGHSVLEYVADHNLTTQVIIISGEATFATATGTLRYDFVHDFIKKPYIVKELLQLISNTKKIIKIKQQSQAIQLQLNQSEQMHRFFVEKSPDMIYLLNQQGQFTFLNNVIADLLGYSAAEMVGKHYSALVHADDLAKAEIIFNIPDTTPIQPRNAELRLYCKDSEAIKYVAVSAIVIALDALDIFKADEQSFGIFGIIRDITEHKLTEIHLRKLNLAMEHSPNLIFITNPAGTIQYTNQQLTATTGYSQEEVLGQTPHIFSSGDTLQEVYQDLWQTLSAGQVWRGILKNKKKSGDIYLAQQSIAPLVDDTGVTTHYVAIQEDVTEASLLNEKLSYQATHDPLTDLINRNEFDRRLERVIMTARDQDSEHALCYMDLDQFKVVNDICSHTAGDELLRQISTLLSQVIRRRDTLARLGGDEFAILMEHCPLEQAQRTTQKIHSIIEKFQFQWEGKSFRIGISIGLIVINIHKGGADTHLKHADMACYMAKVAGRNRTHIYREDDAAIAQHQGEMNWLAIINNALDNNQFCLYTQAIVPLGIAEGEHCEILLRMKNDNGTVTAPGAFLPAAERYQLSPKIDRWVIQNTFASFTEQIERLELLSMCSINLSGPSLNSPNMLAFIEEQLEITGMPADKVCFEITETAAIANLSSATEFITQLKALGCKFSLDDFGSGLSSFAYLKNLPVDFLKIDGFFVKDIEHDQVDLAMVKSINDIGHVMGKKTIAEFVECEPVLQTLMAMKVDYAQGYHTGKPKPINDHYQMLVVV